MSSVGCVSTVSWWATSPDVYNAIPNQIDRTNVLNYSTGLGFVKEHIGALHVVGPNVFLGRMLYSQNNNRLDRGLCE